MQMARKLLFPQMETTKNPFFEKKMENEFFEIFFGKMVPKKDHMPFAQLLRELSSVPHDYK